MYKVKILCFDTPNETNPYEDCPSIDKSFNQYNEAYSYAKELCLNEYLDLCKSCLGEGENTEEATNLYAIMENYEKKTIGVYYRTTSNNFLPMTQYFVTEI